MSIPITIQPATVTVTWMDGAQDAYRADWTVENGLLYLTMADGLLCIPLRNVRHWTAGGAPEMEYVPEHAADCALMLPHAAADCQPAAEGGGM